MVERLIGKHSEDAQVHEPLESAIARFCDQLTSVNTRKAYGSDLRDFSSFATRAGVSQLGELTVEFMDNYLQNCETRGLLGETIRRRIVSLCRLLTQEGMEQLAKETRDIGFKRVGSSREIRMQPLHPLSNEEVEKLQEASQDNPRASAIIAIALGIGATAEEIRALNASDVFEQESGRVAVRFRGKKSEREILLDANSSAVVRRHKGNRQGEDPLFAQKRQIKAGEDRLSRNSVWSDVKQYGKKIGRPDLNPRVLRETFIANTQIDDSKELADLLGVDRDQALRLLKRRRLTQQIPQSAVLFEETTK